MGRLTADFAKAFSRDLKKNAERRGWNLSELEKVIDLVTENSPETMEELRRRRNMHTLSRAWKGRHECHVANAGDWLVSGQRTIKSCSSNAPAVTTNSSANTRTSSHSERAVLSEPHPDCWTEEIQIR